MYFILVITNSACVPLPECVVHCVTVPFKFFMVFSSLIENMTGCSRGLMDGAGELRKPLALLESQPVSSQYTLLYVSASKDGTIIPFIRQPRHTQTRVRAHAHTHTRSASQASGGQ